ncbi:MAG: AAA-like domain-containing protein, partial [Deltaproteobacteria bacterium]|nr:AAA-like domain-containing protein [Deltaproteobacteria bacterium]
MTEKPLKFFNIAGPCVGSKHYMLPALPRLNGVNELIDRNLYFVIHAPRQSGKTTYLQALADEINLGDKYYALYCSLATLRTTKDEKKAMDKIVSLINFNLNRSTVGALQKRARAFDSKPRGAPDDIEVILTLSDLCLGLDRELVVFFDEADSLAELPLISFLTQIRDGYILRSSSKDSNFPISMALVGMRNIKDYASQTRPNSESLGTASPFNIITKTLTLNNFTEEEMKSLYGQHSAATGQAFAPDAIDRAWRLTQGQPWLVNALAKEVIENILKNDYSKTIKRTLVERAAQDLILSGQTHFESLKARLKEPRVKSVMEAVLVGKARFPSGVTQDDRQYCLDLGLLKKGKGENYSPANPIYQEVIIRLMSQNLHDSFTKLSDGFGKKWMSGKGLDLTGLLQAFQIYWR